VGGWSLDWKRVRTEDVLFDGLGLRDYERGIVCRGRFSVHNFLCFGNNGVPGVGSLERHIVSLIGRAASCTPHRLDE
jgi:hypothetical protein